MTSRKRDTQAEAPLPRSDAPEHPIDPADAAFLDPAAVTRAATPAPATTADADAEDTPGFGDYEGERAPRDDEAAGGDAGRPARESTQRK